MLMWLLYFFAETRAVAAKGLKATMRMQMQQCGFVASADLDAIGAAAISSSLLLPSLELSVTIVYGPYIRARLGTAAHFCEVVV